MLQRLWMGALLGAMVVGLIGGGTVRAQQTTQTVEGVFLYSGGETQRTTLLDAVRTSTQQVASAERANVRAQIEEMLRPSPRIVVRRDGTSIVVLGAAGLELRSGADYSATTVAGDWQLRQRIVSGVLEQRLERAGWVQTQRYSLSSDRRTLYIDATLTAPGMTTALSVRLTYTRQ